MTTETITINRLRKMGACEDTLEFLSDRFGDSVTITEENAVSCADDIDWKWASENLLNEDQWLLYEKICYPHWKAYTEARDTLWEAYTEVCDKHQKDYNEACAGLSSADREARDKHLKAYHEVCTPHRKSLNDACAKAFVAAYYTK